MKPFTTFDSKNYTSTNHPLIPNSQEYMLSKKIVSIHSEDRDIIKYPSSSMFEIELPEDMINVVSVRLSSWTFPSNYNTFSALNANIIMTFQLTSLYNPGEHSLNDDLQQSIFEALYYYRNANYFYKINITEGFYNPNQMVTELTNKFNEAVTLKILDYFNQYDISDNIIQDFKNNGGYQQFVIVYNNVSQKIWFGNRCDGFVLTNTETIKYSNVNASIVKCTKTNKNLLPEFVNWGLPNNLGLTRNNNESVSKNDYVPRFYYGDVKPGDDGYWLLPDENLPGSQVSFFESPYKINLMGNSYIYMEIKDLNNIDETSPFNVSEFTQTTNETNGTVNSAFAKIAVPTTPISQWFDRISESHMLFDPPSERIRRLRIKLRYHNGQLVDFGNYDYSFNLEFNMLYPNQNRVYKTYMPPIGLASATL